MRGTAAGARAGVLVLASKVRKWSLWKVRAGAARAMHVMRPSDRVPAFACMEVTCEPAANQRIARLFLYISFGRVHLHCVRRSGRCPTLAPAGGGGQGRLQLWPLQCAQSQPPFHPALPYLAASYQLPSNSATFIRRAHSDRTSALRHSRKGNTIPPGHFWWQGSSPFCPASSDPPLATHPRCRFAAPSAVALTCVPPLAANPTAPLQVYGDYYKLFRDNTFVGRPSSN